MDKIVFSLSFFSFLAGCHAGSEVNVEGKLVYGDYGISTLDLSNQQVTNYRPEPIIITEISKINDTSVLVSIWDIARGFQQSYRKVATYDLQEDILKTMFDGDHAMYFPEYRSVVYYRGNSLLISPIDQIDSTPIVVDTETRPIPFMPIQVSETEFIYESPRDSDPFAIWKYNFATGESHIVPELESCTLSDAIWRWKTKELLCDEVADDGRYTGRYLLSSLDGRQRSINFGRGRPLIYLDHLDALIVQRGELKWGAGVVHALWIYEFDSRRKTKIASESFLTRRVAWIE